MQRTNALHIAGYYSLRYSGLPGSVVNSRRLGEMAGFDLPITPIRGRLDHEHFISTEKRSTSGAGPWRSEQCQAGCRVIIGCFCVQRRILAYPWIRTQRSQHSTVQECIWQQAVEDAEKLLLNSTTSPGFQGLAPLFFLAKWHGDLT